MYNWTKTHRDLDPRHRDRIRGTGTGSEASGQGPRHWDRVRWTGTGSEAPGQGPTRQGPLHRDRVHGTRRGSGASGQGPPGQGPVPRDRVRCRGTALECSASCRMAEIASTLCLPLEALNHVSYKIGLFQWAWLGDVYTLGGEISALRCLLHLTTKVESQSMTEVVFLLSQHPSRSQMGLSGLLISSPR